MRLYHGTNQIINEIDLSQSKPYKDFGRGFYLTADYSRAVAMARRTTTIAATGLPEVMPFLFNPHRCPPDVRILEFHSRSPEWALFVLNNRDKTRPIPYIHDYDIVIGPVADSRVDSILMAYKSDYPDDYTNPENLKRLAPMLKYPGSEYIQYCFCTELGVKQLILDK